MIEEIEKAAREFSLPLYITHTIPYFLKMLYDIKGFPNISFLGDEHNEENLY